MKFVGKQKIAVEVSDWLKSGSKDKDRRMLVVKKSLKTGELGVDFDVVHLEFRSSLSVMWVEERKEGT